MVHSFKTVSCALLDVMTSSLVPVKPWDDSLSVLPTVEVEEFCQTCPDAAHPHTTYVNNLYVYPLSLNYSNQKVFSKVMKKLKFPIKKQNRSRTIFRWDGCVNEWSFLHYPTFSPGKKYFRQDRIQRFWRRECEASKGISNVLSEVSFVTLIWDFLSQCSCESVNVRVDLI